MTQFLAGLSDHDRCRGRRYILHLSDISSQAGTPDWIFLLSRHYNHADGAALTLPLPFYSSLVVYFLYCPLTPLKSILCLRLGAALLIHMLLFSIHVSTSPVHHLIHPSVIQYSSNTSFNTSCHEKNTSHTSFNTLQ
jgi:hypothetical protein